MVGSVGEAPEVKWVLSSDVGGKSQDSQIGHDVLVSNTSIVRPPGSAVVRCTGKMQVVETHSFGIPSLSVFYWLCNFGPEPSSNVSSHVE